MYQYYIVDSILRVEYTLHLQKYIFPILYTIFVTIFDNFG